MFCSIREYQGCTDVAELTRRINADILPAIRDMEGFIEYRLLDCSDDCVTSISMFATEDQADDANEQIAEIVTTSLGDLLPESPTITLGDVLIDTRR